MENDGGAATSADSERGQLKVDMERFVFSFRLHNSVYIRL